MTGTVINDGRQRGLSLLELLVALAVFAVIGSAAYAGLGAILDARAAVDGELERLREIQLALHRFGADVEQTVPRPVRDEFGLQRPALSGDDATGSLDLTRAGWDNPLAVARASLQRLAYRYRDGALVRSYWPVLDRAARGDRDGLQTTLLTRVDALQLRFLDDAGRWLTRWPPVGSDDPQRLPRALELRLRLADWGELRRLWSLADGS